MHVCPQAFYSALTWGILLKSRCMVHNLESNTLYLILNDWGNTNYIFTLMNMTLLLFWWLRKWEMWIAELMENITSWPLTHSIKSKKMCRLLLFKLCLSVVFKTKLKLSSSSGEGCPHLNLPAVHPTAFSWSFRCSQTERKPRDNI